MVGRVLMGGLVLAAPVAVAACSGSESGDGAVAPSTTADPLAEAVVDACGNDLSAVRSTVWGIDPATGAVRWITAVPLAAAYLLRDATGAVRVSLVLRSVEAVVDPASGAVIGYPGAGVHEVLVQVPAEADPPAAGSTLLVDGEAQPSTVVIGGLDVTTAAGSTGQTTVGVAATDAVTAAPVWRVDVGAADSLGSLSRPVAFGDTVVVVSSPPRPSCG